MRRVTVIRDGELVLVELVDEHEKVTGMFLKRIEAKNVAQDIARLIPEEFAVEREPLQGLEIRK